MTTTSTLLARGAVFIASESATGLSPPATPHSRTHPTLGRHGVSAYGSRMEIVRTPDDRFVNLPGWPFTPHYTDVDAADGSGARIRIHHIDEGQIGRAHV